MTPDSDEANGSVGLAVERERCRARADVPQVEVDGRQRRHVDTFHVWWDPQLDEQIERAGRDGRIAGYQVCDWITPLPDPLLGRGMMGDGHIEFSAVTRAVLAAGYAGDIEVEIFNADLWAEAPEVVVDTMAQRYVDLVQPYL